MGKFTKTIHFTIFIKLFFINYSYLGLEEGEDCCKSLCPCFYKSEKSKSNINDEKENSNKEEKPSEKEENKPEENKPEENKPEENKPEENEEAKIGEYSYECTNAVYLSVYIYVGTDEAKFDIFLRNNGTKTWAEDSKLIKDVSSPLSTDEISLAKQKPGEEKSYKIVIKDLENYPAGEYKAIFLFHTNGAVRGEKIIAIVHIKEKDDEKNDNEKNDNEEYIYEINKFREAYNLSEGEYPSNEKILELLKKNNFDFEKAFGAFFD